MSKTSQKVSSKKSRSKSNISTLKCLYSNVDQLLNKMDDLKMLMINDKPDIMILTEVIPKRQQKPILDTQIKIQGYQEFVNFERSALNLGESGIRGVAIYVREDIKCSEVKLSTNYDDQLWVEIKLKDTKKLICGCIYRTPSKKDDQVEKSTAKVCDIIREIMVRKPSHVLICGDFNYPSIDWENEHVLE